MRFLGEALKSILYTYSVLSPLELSRGDFIGLTVRNKTMGKALPDITLDATLTKIATSVTMSICSAEPANFAGIAAVTLGATTMVPGDGNDFNLANGDVSGRKVSPVQKAGVIITTAGTATHLVLDDGVDLIAVTTTVSQAFALSDPVTIPTWDIELRDPI